MQRFFGWEDDRSLGDMLTELRILVVDYFKQETLEPLKNLGKVAGVSFGGALLLGTGFVLFLLGTLRFFQSEVWVFEENAVTWLPYFLTILIGLILAALVGMRIAKGPKRGADERV